MNKVTEDLISNIKADDLKYSEQKNPIQNDRSSQAILEKCLDIEDCVEQIYEKLDNIDNKFDSLASSIDDTRKDILTKIAKLQLDINAIDIDSGYEDAIKMMRSFVLEAEKNIVACVDNKIPKINNIENKINNIENTLLEIDDTDIEDLDNRITKNFFNLENQLTTFSEEINSKVAKINNRDIYDELKNINKNIINNNYNMQINSINTKIDSAVSLLLELKLKDQYKDDDLEDRVKSIEKLIRTIVNSLGNG